VKFNNVESGKIITDYYVFDTTYKDNLCFNVEMSPIRISEYCQKKGEYWYAASFRSIEELYSVIGILITGQQYLFNSKLIASA
jgi:hypothetical protein